MSQFLKGLKKLEGWFLRQKRILPWRSQPTVYRVWISEIMLQQTQVVTVIPYFERMIERFPTVEDLAAAPEEEVLLYWAGLGYYSRARNLRRAAIQVVDQGGFPETREGWLELPGIGNYTAGAVLSIALNQVEPILDGNVERVLSRLQRVSRQRGDTEFKKRLWRLSRLLVVTANGLGIQPSIFNQALMELGALVCTPKNPKCAVCPLISVCKAKASNTVHSYPPKKVKQKVIQVDEKLHCIFDAKERVLLRKRQPGEWRAGLWDFLDTLPKELESSLNYVGKVKSKHVVTRHQIQRTTEVWRVNRLKEKWVAAEEGEGTGECFLTRQGIQQNLKWVSVQEPKIPLGSALKKTWDKVCEIRKETEIDQK